MKDVAVIILNWNGERLLRDYLPSVVKYTPAAIADVIVADNGSTDGSVKLLREHFPEVKVVVLDRNYGFAEGYNRAIAATGYRFTVLLNSDVEVKDDWLTPLYNYMCTHPVCGACQPKIRSLRQPEMFEYAGAAGGFLDCNGYPYCRGRIFDTIEPDTGRYDDTVEVDWASGACLMVDTALYQQLGGLDADFFAHMEEIDLCWRMRLKGRTVVAIGDCAVYHLGGASLNASSPRKTLLNFRNSLLMLHKNLPHGFGRWWLLVRRRLLDTVAAAMFLMQGKPAHALAVVKAHIQYLRIKGRVADSHAARNLLRPVNILTACHLRHRRRFSDL